MVLRFSLLSDATTPIDRLSIWTILDYTAISICLLLSCLGVLILLEVLLGHLALDNHETCIDERLLEQLRLEHTDQVFDSDVFSRWSFNDSSILLDLLLLEQSLLRIGLCLLSQRSLMPLKKFL